MLDATRSCPISNSFSYMHIVRTCLLSRPTVMDESCAQCVSLGNQYGISKRSTPLRSNWDSSRISTHQRRFHLISHHVARHQQMHSFTIAWYFRDRMLPQNSNFHIRWSDTFELNYWMRLRLCVRQTHTRRLDSSKAFRSKHRQPYCFAKRNYAVAPPHLHQKCHVQQNSHAYAKWWNQNLWHINSVAAAWRRSKFPLPFMPTINFRKELTNERATRWANRLVDAFVGTKSVSKENFLDTICFWFDASGFGALLVLMANGKLLLVCQPSECCGWFAFRCTSESIHCANKL